MDRKSASTPIDLTGDDDGVPSGAPKHIIDRLREPIEISDSESDGRGTPKQVGKLNKSQSTYKEALRRSNAISKTIRSTPANSGPPKPGARDNQSRLNGISHSGRPTPGKTSEKNGPLRPALKAQSAIPNSIEKNSQKRKSYDAQAGPSDFRQSNKRRRGEDDAPLLSNDVVSLSGTGTSSRSDALDSNEWGSTQQLRDITSMLAPNSGKRKRKPHPRKADLKPTEPDRNNFPGSLTPTSLEQPSSRRVFVDLSNEEDSTRSQDISGKASAGTVPRSTPIGQGQHTRKGALSLRGNLAAKSFQASQSPTNRGTPLPSAGNSVPHEANGNKEESWALRKAKGTEVSQKVNGQPSKTIGEPANLNQRVEGTRMPAQHPNTEPAPVAIDSNITSLDSTYGSSLHPIRGEEEPGGALTTTSNTAWHKRTSKIGYPDSNGGSTHGGAETDVEVVVQASPVKERPSATLQSPGNGTSNANVAKTATHTKSKFGRDRCGELQSPQKNHAENADMSIDVANTSHQTLPNQSVDVSSTGRQGNDTDLVAQTQLKGDIPVVPAKTNLHSSFTPSTAEEKPCQAHDSLGQHVDAASVDRHDNDAGVVAHANVELGKDIQAASQKIDVERANSPTAMEVAAQQTQASLHLPAELSPAGRRGALIPRAKSPNAGSSIAPSSTNGVNKSSVRSNFRKPLRSKEAMIDKGDEDFGLIIKDAEAHMAHEDQMIAQQFANEEARSRKGHSTLFDISSEEDARAGNGNVTSQNMDDNTTGEDVVPPEHVKSTNSNNKAIPTKRNSPRPPPKIDTAPFPDPSPDMDTQAGATIENSELEATELFAETPRQVKPQIVQDLDADVMQKTETVPILETVADTIPQTAFEAEEPQAGTTEPPLPITDTVEMDLTQPAAAAQSPIPDASFISPSQIAPASRTIRSRCPQASMASGDDTPEDVPIASTRTKRSRIPRVLQDSDEFEDDSLVVAETPDISQPHNAEVSLKTKTPPVTNEPLTLLDVQGVLRRHLKDLHDEHQALTQRWLARSRCFRSPETSSSPLGLVSVHANGMVGLKHAVSPFADMQPLHTIVNARAATEEKRDQLILCSDNVKPPGTSKAYVKAPITTWTDESAEVPCYTHYASLSRNILGNNTLQLHVWPFFGDAMTDDTEVYTALEAKFYTVVKDRPLKVFRAQQAMSFALYVEAFLLEIGCSIPDVLRYLLEPDGKIISEASRGLIQRDKLCEEDYDRETIRWTKVLTSLPPSSPDGLRKAALACTAFWGSKQFSLWHVVRKDPYARLADAAVEQADQSYRALACRVCHIHDCPYHGENREHDASSEVGDDDERSINSTDEFDTDYPPDTNIKKRVICPETEDSEHIHVGGTVPSKATSKQKSVDWWMEKSKTYDHGHRPPFLPCNHPGLACDQANCRCFRDSVMCEKACGCAKTCDRRYKGCSCKQGQGKRKVCYPNDRCECWRMNRECDPDLCGSCGAHLVLDRENRYDEGLQESCCHNISIQLGRPKRTLLGNSRIHGFGLYAGEAIKKDDFIGEYQGEIIGDREMQRRDAIYKLQNLSYVFSLNSKQSIDSQQLGNKIRFINAASEHKNLGAKIMLCNMTHRIGMYAIHDIKKGDELFFDYGKDYPDNYLTAQASAIPKSQNTKLIEDFVEPDAEDKLSAYDSDDDDADDEPLARANNRGRPKGKAPARPKGKLVPAASALLKSSTKISASSARKSEDQSAFRRNLGKRMISADPKSVSTTPNSGRTSSHGGARPGAGRPPGSGRKGKVAGGAKRNVDGDGDEEMGDADDGDDGEAGIVVQQLEEADSEASEFVDESEEGSSQDVPRRSGRRRTRTKAMDD